MTNTTNKIIDTLNNIVRADNLVRKFLNYEVIDDTEIDKIVDAISINDSMFDALSRASKNYINKNLLNTISEKIVYGASLTGKFISITDLLLKSLCDVYDVAF